MQTNHQLLSSLTLAFAPAEGSIGVFFCHGARFLWFFGFGFVFVFFEEFSKAFLGFA